VALTNIALDQLGAARLLLRYAGEADGRDEDQLAYLRTDREYRNVLLVELPDRDFAVLVAKLLFLSAFQRLTYAALVSGPDARLAEIAAKTVKESAYHLDHSAQWTVRLGDGTELSHERMQAAVDEVWPYTHELFEDAPELREPWLSTVDSVLAGATLARPDDRWKPTGGRHGRHTEALSYLLAEMQVLHRTHPGARW
jgi:ring-1,2-phenylacetyl-CoA epoxidase subunit PaaC